MSATAFRPASRRLLRASAACGAALSLALAGAAPAAATPPGAISIGLFGVPPAYSYLPDLVPVGSVAVVRTVETGDGATVARLLVRGVAPGQTFDVHAHVGACSADPATALGHYKNDPAGPADSVNELWLGFTSGSSGHGSARARVSWQFREGGARSITLHRHADGARAACLNVSF